MSCSCHICVRCISTNCAMHGIRRSCAKARTEFAGLWGFNGKGHHIAIGPNGWDNWHPAKHEIGKRTLFHSAPVVAASSPPTDASPRPASPDDTDDIGKLLGSLQLENDVRKRPLGFDEAYHTTSDSDSYSGGGDDGDGCRELAACDSECGYDAHLSLCLPLRDTMFWSISGWVVLAMERKTQHHITHSSY